MKTFKFSLVLRTRENADVFITLDDNIYGINISSIYYTISKKSHQAIVIFNSVKENV